MNWSPTTFTGDPQSFKNRITSAEILSAVTESSEIALNQKDDFGIPLSLLPSPILLMGIRISRLLIYKHVLLFMKKEG